MGGAECGNDDDERQSVLMKGRVSTLIADSLDGRTLNSCFSSNLIKERESVMKDEDARGFYE